MDIDYWRFPQLFDHICTTAPLFLILLLELISLYISWVREQELHLSCQSLGVQHAVCLDYVDGTLASVDAEMLTGRVVEIIRCFRPDVVITFGPDGGYGHPDHIAISAATTAACQRSAQSDQFPAQLAAGLPVHQPARLFHSYFPSKRQSLLEKLVQWLMQSDKRFRGTLDFTYALLLFCEEASLLPYSSDHFDISWYPAGISIIEQGEQANSLLCWLLGTSVRKIGESRHSNRSHLPSCLHEKLHRLGNSRTAKPMLNEHTFAYLVNQVEKYHFLLVCGRKRGRKRKSPSH